MSSVGIAGAAASQGAVRYVGFWARCLASLIDTILVSCIIAPLALAFDRDRSSVDGSAVRR